MDILLKSATIIDPNSKHHLSTKDILIERGRISRIANSIPAKKFKTLKANNLHVSIGWMDMNAHFCDPGLEHKEDIKSGIECAVQGGFTGVALLPNTNPPIHSKSQVEYIKKQQGDGMVDLYPYGAITMNCEGLEPTEIYDMKEAGAIAFTDGTNSIQNAGILERGLMYVKPFKGLIINHPEVRDLAGEGLMHEGHTSTRLGLKGSPAIAEELAVSRDIQLAKYTGSRIHFSAVSTQKAIELIKEAKKDKISVSAGIAPYNLLYTDNELRNFDTNLKVIPHLREKKDVDELIKGLKDGTIDVISSHHRPQDKESKDVEFNYAEFGMISLETTFSICRTALGNKIKLTKLIEALSSNPRKLLGLQTHTIDLGETANLTLFDPDQNWTCTKQHIKSKSNNTPFIGHSFVGKVIGIINRNKIKLAD